MTDVHMSSAAGDAACHPDDPRPRVTSDVRLVTCPGCGLSNRYNARLRVWLLRQIRADRAAVASAVLR